MTATHTGLRIRKMIIELNLPPHTIARKIGRPTEHGFRRVHEEAEKIGLRWVSTRSQWKRIDPS